MSIGWKFYLNAVKAQGSYLSELQWLRTRIRTVKAERNELRALVKTYLKPAPPGWTFEICSCGFSIITMPGGKHYCPKCS